MACYEGYFLHSSHSTFSHVHFSFFTYNSDTPPPRQRLWSCVRSPKSTLSPCKSLWSVTIAPVARPLDLCSLPSLDSALSVRIGRMWISDNEKKKKRMRTSYSLPTFIIDVGNAQLSMHSCREVCGSEDVSLAIKLFEVGFLSRWYSFFTRPSGGEFLLQ